jgi:hypothetical protein
VPTSRRRRSTRPRRGRTYGTGNQK